MNTLQELPTEVRRSLEALAERTGRSPDDLIQEAVRDFVGRHEPADDPGWPRSIGMGETDEPRAADVDDWLRANWRPEDDWGRI